jgi:hypothetical protein
MDHACGAVVPLIISHTSGVLCPLYLLEQRGMITGFDPKNIV